MWTTKTFLTKTKRGNVLKIVREHYLRDDLLCGSEACKSCGHKHDENVLEKSPKSICTSHDYPHYLVIDTNVVLHQIDVLEEDALTNVIVLQTVLEEVKHQNQAIFQRLLMIVDNKKRRFYSFVNEHHKDTFVERLPGEKANDRNDRAIRRAAAWYSTHLRSDSGKAPRIVLLTDDEQSRAKAKEEGIVCSTVRDYIKSVQGFVGLEDKLSKNVIPETASQDALYPAHLTPSQVHEGIRAGRLRQGTFHASRDNFLEGSVNVDGFDKAILLQGHSGINRSVDGDLVAVEIFPESEWRKPSGIVLEDKTEDPGDQLEEESALLQEARPTGKADDEITPTGRVVGIIRRKWRQYCGILQPSSFPGATRHLFVPAEKRVPRVRIETRQSDALASQRILVALDSWPRNSRYPLGHFVRALGPIGDKDAENEVLLLEHDVPHARFSEAVLACLPPDDWTIPEEEIAKRVDLRDICVCSVDPPGCTDIDDALHARLVTLPSADVRKYDVGVHIADVTHFVRPNTALDKEAASRSTTVYLVDKRIDMVPDLLSSNLCSLRGNEERLAFSCVWTLDENANVLTTKFHKSVIKSKAAMTYEEAQIAIDDDTRQDEIASSLRILNMLAKKLKKKRLDNGALLLASPEIRFQVDSETHDPIEVQSKKIMDTNSMVEEFMLLANVSVAERLAADFPQCALLRRHPSPPPANFTSFLKAAKQQGFDIDVSTNASFSKSLDAAVIPSRPFFNTLLRIMATRCMMQAVYFSSGTTTKEEYYHYGLACPIYTHFTSPIRRYADVMVHRLLAATIGADTTHATLLDTRAANAICDNLNYRHRQAQYAGRASVALNTHILFRSRVEMESAVVLAVKRNALQVLIPKYGLEGPLFLPSDMFSYNEEEQYQVCGDVKMRTFDEIRVRLSLDSRNLQHRRLLFQLVEPHVPGFSYIAEDEASEGKVEGKLDAMDVDAQNVKRKEKSEERKSKKKKKK